MSLARALEPTGAQMIQQLEQGESLCRRLEKSFVTNLPRLKSLIR